MSNLLICAQLIGVRDMVRVDRGDHKHDIFPSWINPDLLVVPMPHRLIDTI